MSAPMFAKIKNKNMPKKVTRKCKLCKGELTTTDAWTERFDKIINSSSTSAPASNLIVRQILAKVYKRECKQCRDITLEIEEWKNK